MSTLPMPGAHEPAPADLTYRQVVNLYLSSTAAQQDPRTFAERKRVLELFAARFGHLAVQALRPSDVLFWLAEHPDWRSDWTRKRIVATVGRPLSWAKKLRLIHDNSLSGFGLPDGNRGRPLRMEELRKLLKATDANFRRVLVFLYYSGARPCEMTALCWDMIDPERGAAVFLHHKTSRSRKDRAPRTLVLHPVVLKLLCVIRRRQKVDEQRVFLNRLKLPWTRNALVLRMQRLRGRCQLPDDAKLYGLRHMFATQVMRRTGDLKVLAELLGHTTTKMAEHYVHIAGDVEHLRAALGKAFRKP